MFMFFILLSLNSIGQTNTYQRYSIKDLKLLSDLNNYIRGASESISQTAIVYPYVFRNIEIDSTNIEWLSNEFGFTKRQLTNIFADTISLRYNGYFEVVDADSILKYENKIALEVEKGLEKFETIDYYLAKIYLKINVRYFYRPIITKNGAFAIVGYEDNCGLWGSNGKFLIMQYKKGKWQYIKSLALWNS